MSFNKLSIIIPCYNEENTIGVVLDKISSAECSLQKEIIVVNDGSTDNTGQVIDQYIQNNPGSGIIHIHHHSNSGKGSCIQSALKKVTGELIIIQDADQEYSPVEYQKMMAPVLDGYADVVYGSRFRGSEAHRVLFFAHTIGNKFLTFFSNLLSGLNLTDMETGFKLFKKEILEKIQLKESRFGFEPEVTAKISKIKNIRIYEVGISYYGRSYQEGKKINWKDGVRAMYCILKYNLFK